VITPWEDLTNRLQILIGDIHSCLFLPEHSWIYNKKFYSNDPRTKCCSKYCPLAVPSLYQMPGDPELARQFFLASSLLVPHHISSVRPLGRVCLRKPPRTLKCSLDNFLLQVSFDSIYLKQIFYFQSKKSPLFQAWPSEVMNTLTFTKQSVLKGRYLYVWARRKEVLYVLIR